MIISITPDLALDEGYTYAGGLGVLEGDKFYGAAKLGIPYKALSLFYREGYVDYEFDDEGNPVPKPQSQPQEFLDKLVVGDVLNIELKGQTVKVESLRYKHGSAEAVFFNPLKPEWASRLVNRLYIEGDLEGKFLKYTLLAKASAECIRRYVGVDKVDYIDLQEAYACIMPLILKLPGKYRITLHTAGWWGHPSFPKQFFEKEFGYRFIGSDVLLTEVGLAASEQAFSVSAKHFEVMSRVIPQFTEKLRYVTNGVFVERWMDSTLKAYYERGDLHLDHFIEQRKSIKERFSEYIRQHKDVDIGDRIVATWCRRLTKYKRPEFAIKAVNETPSENVFFILGGKAHPSDDAGLLYMKTFYKLHKEKENVVYIPNYSVSVAKEVIKSADLLLFTPFPGWEACGTSYMKAAVNGVPTLSSPDGGVIELVINDVNGWLFGSSVSDVIEPGTAAAEQIDASDYIEFKGKLQDITSLFKNSPERYYRVSLNALLTLIPRAGIERVLREYYPNIVKICI